MLGFVNSFMSWYLKKRISTIEYSFSHADRVQMEVFEKLLYQARKTSFGRDRGLSNVNTLDEYREAVPIFEYDDIKPYINRVMLGEQKVLWPEEINWFAKSSGTTSDKSKFIPVSYDALEECQFMGSRDVLAYYYHNNPEAKIFQGKGLIIGGSHEVNSLAENSFYGDLSAVMMNNMPFIANYLATPSMDIALLADWETKMERMVESTHQENVTNISGVPSWTLLLLQAVLKKTKAKNIIEVWPNLELYVHGGVSFLPYREQFKEIIGKEIAYRETYNASEGFFGVQDLEGEDMLLMLDYGVFYEFIPLDEYEKEKPRTLWINEVEIGTTYVVIINTNAGLWRYVLGDTIKFSSKNPYRFKIVGRTKSFINAFGEELMVQDTELAIAELQKKHNCLVASYTAAPVYLKDGQTGRHQWAIEFDKEPSSIIDFGEDLDRKLQNLNSDYESKREGSMVLDTIEIVVCRRGTFYNWLKANQKLGGQHKIPKLCNNRKIITEILKINEDT